MLLLVVCLKMYRPAFCDPIRMNSEQVFSINTYKKWECVGSAASCDLWGVLEQCCEEPLQSKDKLGCSRVLDSGLDTCYHLKAAGQLRTYDTYNSCHKTKTFYGMYIELNV